MSNAASMNHGPQNSLSAETDLDEEDIVLDDEEVIVLGEDDDQDEDDEGEDVLHADSDSEGGVAAEDVDHDAPTLPSLPPEKSEG
ncbi:hypothetical protein LVJ94_35035 [Pendulispora rubella]|uniref:Uncharacterized protein n=1 Tax=Pendulispora rubella TaxID=2741070 RepID=A0ABZ2KUC5_9BACT